MRWVVVAVVGLLAGCVVDKMALTQFQPTDGNQFQYAARTDAVVYPLDDQKAEAQRMQWLAQYLSDNKLCPAGYQVTERKPVKTAEAALGDLYTIYYRGHCT